jgi:hypothetical protein
MMHSAIVWAGSCIIISVAGRRVKFVEIEIYLLTRYAPKKAGKMFFI